MMYRWILLFCALALTACAVTANTHPQEDGSFLISVHSNAFGSVEGVNRKFQQRAEKACGGADFEFKQYLPAELKEIRTYDAYNTSAHVVTQRRVVVCH